MTRWGKAFLGLLILKTNPELKIREIKEQIIKNGKRNRIIIVEHLFIK